MDKNLKNTITLVKNGERYLFRFDDANHKALLGVFGRFAADPRLNFSWHDAAVLAREVRRPRGEQPQTNRIGGRS